VAAAGLDGRLSTLVAAADTASLPAPPEPTLCVVMHQAGNPSERFIERHVRESFGGRTVALARHPGRPAAFTQPLLVADALPPARGAMLLAYARHRQWDLPAGRRQVAVHDFWRRHGVAAVLAEFGPLGCWIAPAARAYGVPLFVYFRGYDASSRLRSPRTVRAYRRLMGQIDGVFAVSAFLLDNLRQVGVVHPNSVVLPSGVDVTRFGSRSKDPNLVAAVGRLVDKKCPELTIQAFASAAAGRPALRLEMVGEGPARERCEALARTLGVGERVQFHGARDHAFVADLLSRARVFMQHSVTSPRGETEGQPSSIQEALAASAVVVATRHAGIPELVIDGETGWLVDEHDGDAYAAALARVLDDPARADRMAAAARRLAEERLDTRRLQARMEAVITRAIERTGGRATDGQA